MTKTAKLHYTPGNNTHSLTVIDLFDIALHFLNADIDVIERGQTNVSLDLCPRWYLIDGALRAGHLGRLEGGGRGKLVALLLGMLGVGKITDNNYSDVYIGSTSMIACQGARGF